MIESTYGLDQLVLAVLFEAIIEEELENGDTRLVLKINPSLAPIKVNVLPLIKKRHRRGDAIGTPYAVTIYDTTIENGTVTV